MPSTRRKAAGHGEKRVGAKRARVEEEEEREQPAKKAKDEVEAKKPASKGKAKGGSKGGKGKGSKRGKSKQEEEEETTAHENTTAEPDKEPSPPADAMEVSSELAPSAEFAGPAGAAATVRQIEQVVSSALSPLVKFLAAGSTAGTLPSPTSGTKCSYLWLRAEPGDGGETKQATNGMDILKTARAKEEDSTGRVDRRAPITPNDAKTLVRVGFKVTVESSATRCFPDHEYAKAGCQVVPAGSWDEAPEDALIIGVRDVPYGRSFALRHKHLFFSHAFTHQEGWQRCLTRFLRGGGVLYDYEYLQDTFEKRLVSFGAIAGQIAMATGLLAWCNQHNPKAKEHSHAELDQLPLQLHMQQLLAEASDTLKSKRLPKVVVLGGYGVCGSGAVTFANMVGLKPVAWGRDETSRRASEGTLQKQLMSFDILVNAVRLDSQGEADEQPFLTTSALQQGRNAGSGLTLSVIVDISCDVHNPRNKLPLSNTCTSFDRPIVRLLPAIPQKGLPSVDLIAIPNLSNLLPNLSSKDFSSQLLPLLLQLQMQGFEAPEWKRCKQSFEQMTQSLRPNPHIFKRGRHALLPLTTHQKQVLRLLTPAAQPGHEGKAAHDGLSAARQLLANAVVEDGLVVKVARADPSETLDDVSRKLRHALLGLIKRHDIFRTELVALRSTGPAPSQLVQTGDGGAGMEKMRDEGEEGEEKEEDDEEADSDDEGGVPEEEERALSTRGYFPSAHALMTALPLQEGEAPVSQLLRSVRDEAIANLFSKGSWLHLVAWIAPTVEGGLRTLHLYLVLHPLVADCYTARAILLELTQAYCNGVHSLPALQLQFGDYADWRAAQRKTLPDSPLQKGAYRQKDEEGEEIWKATRARSLNLDPAVHALADLKYWMQQLDSSAPVLQVPTDRRRPPVPSMLCLRVRHTLSAQLSRAIDHAIASASEKAGDDRHSKSWRVFSFFLSLWTLLLHRRTLESDLVVGSTLGGRTQHSLLPLLGPLANQVMFRLQLDPERPDQSTFAQLWTQAHRVVLEAVAAQNAPFAWLLEALRATKAARVATPARHPTCIAFSPVALQVAPELLDSTAQPFAFPAAPANVTINEFSQDLPVRSPLDLQLTVSGQTEEGGGRVYVFEMMYANELFELGSIQETLGQLEQLAACLTSSVQHMEQTNILDHTLRTPAGLKVLPDPNSQMNYSWGGAITACFDRTAQKYANKIAIDYRGVCTTYGDLRQQVAMLAHELRAAGIGKGDVVSLYGHRSPGVVIAILGTLASGAAYSMLDPAYPASRIIDCLGVSLPTAWLSIQGAPGIPAEVTERLKELKLKLQKTVEDGFPEGKRPSKPLSLPAVDIQQTDIAVVTFTSGSTGIPKGVEGRHSALTHYYPWMAQRFGLGDQDRFSLCSGIAHDPLQRDIFTPCFFGASMHIPEANDITEPGALAQWFKKAKITVACLTPAMGQLLCSAVGGTASMGGGASTAISSDPAIQLEDLKYVFFVGDMLIKRDVGILQSIAPKVSVINMYGSTETQRSVGYIEVKHGDLERMNEVISCGVGMKGCMMMVLNKRSQLTGIGELGEIYMRSPHIAKGYLRLEQTTKEKFVPNPFDDPVVAAKDTQRKASGLSDMMYRTGDLGRYSIEGNVECAGRADDQVKIRGFRIELGEVNAVLSKHALAKENVTVMRGQAGTNRQLISYIVPTAAASAQYPPSSPDPGHPLRVDARTLSQVLRDHLKKFLPHYMVPSYVVIIPSMPLTPNGKINRDALPAPSASNSTLTEAGGKKKKAQKKKKQRVGGKAAGAEAETEDVELLSEVAAKMVKVWSQVLQVGTVRASDDFFDLGGHSLLATQLTVALRAELGPPISEMLEVRHLLEHSSVAQLSAFLEAKSKGDGGKGESKVFDLDKEAEAVAATLKVDPAVSKTLSLKPFPTTIFLTGATGFLGAFLVRELMTHTSAQVICPVRVRAGGSPQERLQRSLQDHGLWDRSWESRIKAVSCELSEPQLGFSEAEFNSLAQSVDLILHNAAFVHWLLPYGKLKPTNVDGTMGILQLAVTNRLKPVHIVSTTSVLEATHHQQASLVEENDPLSTSAGLSGGYPQSKWVAEKVAMAARAKGVPVSIYRPGYITGDSAKGLWNTDDFLCRLIKGCIELNACPFSAEEHAQTGSTLDMAPVDWVAKTIVKIMVKNTKEADLKALNQTYHVTNPARLPIFKLFDTIASCGYELKNLPYEEWRAQLLQAVEQAGGAGNTLAPVINQFTSDWIQNLTGIKLGRKNVESVLKGDKEISPVIDTALMTTYVNYLLRCGFLAAPAHPATNALAIDWGVIRDGVSMLTRTSRN